MSEKSPTSIRIWVDADACPNAIKEILFRTAQRLHVPLVLVANQTRRVPQSQWVTVITVPYGADVADNVIVKKMQSGDVVITGDIPLAAQVVAKGGIAIGPRGQRYDDTTVHDRLASRNLMEQFRSAGIETGGPKPLSPKDIQAFANQLDRTLTRIMRTGHHPHKKSDTPNNSRKASTKKRKSD